MMPNAEKIDARNLQNPARTVPKIFQKPFLGASRRIGSMFENDAAGLIESGGFWAPKNVPWRFPNGFENASDVQ